LIFNGFIKNVSLNRMRAKKKGQIALTDRQMRIVEHINQNGRISVGDMRGMFKITRQAALKELKTYINGENYTEQDLH